MRKFKNNLIINIFLLIWLASDLFRHGLTYPLIFLMIITVLAVAMSYRDLMKVKSHPELQSETLRKINSISKKFYFPLYFVGFLTYAYSITKDMGAIVQGSVFIIGIITFTLSFYLGYPKQAEL